jgi:hypothetical protein
LGIMYGLPFERGCNRRMAQRRVTINFQCSPALKKVLLEAAGRSQVSLSEQARMSLEKLYEVEEQNQVWLPDILKQRKN